MGTRYHPIVFNQPYFVTAVIKNRLPVFRNREAADLMMVQLDRARREFQFSLLAYAIMPDHIHLILVPDDSANLSRIIRTIKGRFARLWNQRFGEVGSLWQERYYESAVRTEAQLQRWIEYIDQNPVKTGLTPCPQEYLYCSRGGKLKVDWETYLGGRTPGRAEARPSVGRERCGGGAR